MSKDNTLADAAVAVGNFGGLLSFASTNFEDLATSSKVAAKIAYTSLAPAGCIGVELYSVYPILRERVYDKKTLLGVKMNAIDDSKVTDWEITILERLDHDGDSVTTSSEAVTDGAGNTAGTTSGGATGSKATASNVESGTTGNSGTLSTLLDVESDRCLHACLIRKEILEVRVGHIYMVYVPLYCQNKISGLFIIKTTKPLLQPSTTDSDEKNTAVEKAAQIKSKFDSNNALWSLQYVASATALHWQLAKENTKKTLIKSINEIMTEILRPWCMSESESQDDQQQPMDPRKGFTILESYCALMRSLIPCERVSLFMYDSEGGKMSLKNIATNTASNASWFLLQHVKSEFSGDEVEKEINAQEIPPLELELDSNDHDTEDNVSKDVDSDAFKKALKDQKVKAILSLKKNIGDRSRLNLLKHHALLKQLALIAMDKGETCNVSRDIALAVTTTKKLLGTIASAVACYADDSLDVLDDSLDDSEVFETIRSVLSIPIQDQKGIAIGVLQFVNRQEETKKIEEEEQHKGDMSRIIPENEIVKEIPKQRRSSVEEIHLKNKMKFLMKSASFIEKGDKTWGNNNSKVPNSEIYSKVINRSLKLFFNNCDIQFVNELCQGPMTLGIQIASLALKLQKRELQNEAIKGLVHILSNANAIPEIMEAIRSKVRDVLGCQRAACFLVDEDHSQIWSPASTDCPQGLVVSADKGIVGVVARTGEVYVANQVRKDPIWHGDVDPTFRTVNMLTVPVKSSKSIRNQVVGVVQACNKSGDFTKSDVEIMTILASEIANHFDRLAFTILHEKAKIVCNPDTDQNVKTSTLLASFYRDDQEQTKKKTRDIASSSRQGGDIRPTVKGNLTTNIERFIALNKYNPRTDWEIPYYELSDEEGLGMLLFGLQFSFELCPTGILLSVIEDLKRSYLDPPFHNWCHALQVFHNAVLMDNYIPLLPEVLEPIQTLAFLLAGLGHDVGHRGKNNPFEIVSQSELAILYNDLSVLENHHASTCSNIMIKRGLLTALPDGSGKAFRRIIVNSILGTDMSKHGNLLKKLQTLEICDDPELLITCCTHCADLGAQILPLNTAWEFYMRCTEEFMMQAKKEEELGLPVTPFMSGQEDPQVRAFGQVQFIEFVVAPLWIACSTALPTRGMLAEEEESSLATEKKEKSTEKSEWLYYLHQNLEVYKFVASHGKRRDWMTEEELKEKGLLDEKKEES